MSGSRDTFEFVISCKNQTSYPLQLSKSKQNPLEKLSKRYLGGTGNGMHIKHKRIWKGIKGKEEETASDKGWGNS